MCVFSPKYIFSFFSVILFGFEKFSNEKSLKKFSF